MSRSNNQFSVATHIMTSLGDHYGEHVTSSELTGSVQAHDTLVRLVLSKLVKAGLVTATRGRNGSTALSKPANKITLLDIYNAVESPPVFSIHSYSKNKNCKTSRTHKDVMTEVLADAQNAFENFLSKKNLSELVEKARTQE